jgi:hypothetical protein
MYDHGPVIPMYGTVPVGILLNKVDHLLARVPDRVISEFCQM